MSTENNSLGSVASRREFLKSATAATALVAATGIVKTPVYGQNQAPSANVLGANSRINIGHIGVGGQGMAHVSQMKPKHGDNNTQSVAVCDVSKHRQEFAKAKILDGNAGAKVDTYGDYRKLLERKDIDVIVCSTVDHWHTKVSVDALNAGKHV